MKNATYADALRDPDSYPDSEDAIDTTVSMHWNDGRAQHEDHVHFEQPSVAGEFDDLPGDIGAAICDAQPGSVIRTQYRRGELFGPWSQEYCHLASSSTFQRNLLPDIPVEPRIGRFYPRKFFLDLPEFMHDVNQPARITRLSQESMSIDLNNSLARFRLDMEIAVNGKHHKIDSFAGDNVDVISQFGSFTGLKACLEGNANTDYGDDMEGLACLDSEDDAVFYQHPRMTQHLDMAALKTVNRLYRRLIPDGAEVLDIMASHDSHLQGVKLHSLHIIGLNQEELAANEAANVSMVHNLNAEPVILLTDDSVDAVVCTVSIEYFTNPIAILTDIRRVLRQGGVFIATFSNRWFPTKSVRIWSQLQEFERVGLVTQWMASCGFENLHTYSDRGRRRPAGDIYHGELNLSDPVHAVWGYKP